MKYYVIKTSNRGESEKSKPYSTMNEAERYVKKQLHNKRLKSWGQCNIKGTTLLYDDGLTIHYSIFEEHDYDTLS